MLWSRGFGINSFLFNGRSRSLSDQPCDFAVQSRDHSSNPNDPFRRSLALRKQHFDSLLVPEQALSKGAIESFDDCLVPLNLCAPTANVSISLVTVPMNSRSGSTARWTAFGVDTSNLGLGEIFAKELAVSANYLGNLRSFLRRRRAFLMAAMPFQ